MRRVMKEHDQYMRQEMNAGRISLELAEYHKQQIVWLQHERLIHLMVTLFTLAMLMAFSAIALMMKPGNTMWGAVVLLIILSFFYLKHYFDLENTVQRWYELSNGLHRSLYAQDEKKLQRYF